MSGDEQRKRFVVRDARGRERPLATVEDLHDEVAAGRVGIEDEIFDSSTGAWSPAGKIPVFQFIVEELEAEGKLPERLESGQVPGDGDASAPLIDGGEAPPVELDRDPLDLSLDLVESEPPPPEPRGSGAVDETTANESSDDPPPTTASGRTTGASPADAAEPPLTLQQRLEGAVQSAEEDEFQIRPGSALDDDWQALSRVDPSTRGSDRDLDRRESRGERPGDRGFRREEDNTREASPVSDSTEGPDTGDDEAVPWQPDRGEGTAGASPAGRRPPVPSPERSGRGGLVAAFVAGVLILLAGGWFLLAGGGSDEPDPVALESTVPASPPPPALPPPPAGAQDQVQAGLQGVEDRFQVVKDSLRAELDLAPAPPREWLGGAYLADATAFPQVRDFWEGYEEFLRQMQPLDRQIYLEGVETGLEGWGGGGDHPIMAYFEERYSGLRSFRMARYESLAAVTRAALNLHDVLARHRAQISFSPAVGRGVSADPILEAVIPEGPVRQEVEAALDQVFRALDRSRGGGVPSMDGLRSELFERFGEG